MKLLKAFKSSYFMPGIALYPLLFLLFLCIEPIESIAHDSAYHGELVDENDAVVADAYIINQTSGSHAHSNDFGKFVLSETEAGDTIIVSHIGYETVVLFAEANQLDDLVTVQMTQTDYNLSQVTISHDIRRVNQITAMDLTTNPVNNSQEILRTVPGLFIGQHAGGGKSEQLFLRGFDIDHGTDVSIKVDGMPVNMVSHAHGQGYADLHFVIPETVEEIDYGKGPYYADQGNFNTAGYVNLKTKEQFKHSLAQVEYGRFNTVRMLGIFDLLDRIEKHSAWVAGEYTLTDGPFESSQNFNRINLMGKYVNRSLNNQRISISASHFSSKWDASGQIPQRAVDSGLITRFGAIDDTEGGNTQRTNINLEYSRFLSETASVRASAYYSRYEFELFSNFTFFLEDPVNGDQIRQFEDRNIYGVSVDAMKLWNRDRNQIKLEGGVGMRYDDVNSNELSRTLNRRTTLEQLAFGDVDETNIFAYLNSEFKLGKVTINPGVRLDFFKFDYNNRLDSLYSTQSTSRAIASPKLNIIYKPLPALQLFVKSGMGFHSNDTRVVLEQSGKEILPYAVGVDVGLTTKPVKTLWLEAAFWYLYLQQEFVYVGDAGVVEPSGKTKRLGMDFSARYQPIDWLQLAFDINYSFARSINDPEGANRIPLAPNLTSTGAVTFSKAGFNGGIHFRYLRDRPANEDNSIIAEGYFIADLNLSYSHKWVKLGVEIQNLFNSDWNETQFATESRLDFETEPVEEIHFTPGTPFYVKGFVGFMF